jgi:hypothetical protein
MSRKTIDVMIFVNPGANSTKSLTRFIAKNIDKINIKFKIKFIKVTKDNYAKIKQKGITETPALVIGRKKITGARNIIRLFEPCLQLRHGFSKGVTSADEEIHSWQMRLLDTGDENGDDDDDDPSRRGDIIRHKMAALQKKRPEMRGTDESATISGGRKIKSSGKVKSSFLDDADFIASTGVDNIEDTPHKSYLDEADGDLILEDYYLDEAYQQGKKVKPGRRRM